MRAEFMKFLLFISSILSIGLFGMKDLEESISREDEATKSRYRMVENQIQARGVSDPRVLSAMREVPRHKFVPEKQVRYAYDDTPLPIGHGQTISQPYIVAYMTEMLELKGSERVLEVGTGSGYQAAVLSELAKEVYSIEIVEPLCAQADSVLSALGYANVHVRCGDGYAGWPEKAPFDAVIVTAAPVEIPQPLLDQLGPGGRLIAPVGKFFQQLVLLTKKDKGEYDRKELIPVRFVPMTGQAQK
jgi:protein-L-isoaspartate(D-aspartate) O-methyltransferase